MHAMPQCASHRNWAETGHCIHHVRMFITIQATCCALRSGHHARVLTYMLSSVGRPSAAWAGRFHHERTAARVPSNAQIKSPGCMLRLAQLPLQFSQKSSCKLSSFGWQLPLCC